MVTPFGKDEDRVPQVPVSTLVAVVAIVLITTGGFVGLTLAGRDISQVAYFVLPMISATLVGLVNNRKLDRLKSETSEIKTNSNGRLSNLINQNRGLVVERAALESQLRENGLRPITEGTYVADTTYEHRPEKEGE